MQKRQVAFAGSPIDRADNIRSDPEALGGLMNWRARLLKLDGLRPVFDDMGVLEWGTLADAAEDAELVFLGMLDGKACFAAVPEEGAGGPAYSTPEIFRAMQMLQPGELATYGGARSLCDWHARHRFCARCGGRTRIAKGGWQRDCEACGAQHFPRTDPVTIMLVEHEGELMLGRGKGWPEGRYSALAGFVEPGETIEEAVAREVLEESGVAVRDVSYVASQPWPFPSQLMIGCHSFADAKDLTIDHTELADVRWFTRQQILDAREAGETGAHGLIFPRSVAIASHLVDWWLAR